MSFQTDLMDDARAYLSAHFKIDIGSDVPSESVRTFIESLYVGGWSHYEANFRRYLRTMTVEPGVEEFSPIKKRAIVSELTRRLKEYDEILSFDFQQGVAATFVVSRATAVDERSRRTIITERELILTKLVWTDGVMSKSEVSMTEAVAENHHRFGGITTVQRAAEQKEQFETCYRPGTSNTPLQGWVARLEISHKEAHPEMYPSTTTTKES